MRRFDRIVLCLLTAGVCTIAAQQVLRAGTAGASVYQDASSEKAEHQIAVCAVNKIVRDLLESDRFLPAREAIKLEEIVTEYRELEAELNELRQQWEQIQQGGQGDPATIQTEAERIGARMQELEQIGSEREQQLQQLTLAQLKEAYELTRGAAEAVAEDLGYPYVASSQRPDDEFNLNSASLPAEFNARPILVYPEGVDITPDVLAELNLD
jgi:Skp family chaperone for outer membrane proteins